jgi:hypothetical protein
VTKEQELIERLKRTAADLEHAEKEAAAAVAEATLYLYAEFRATAERLKPLAIQARLMDAFWSDTVGNTFQIQWSNASGR